MRTAFQCLCLVAALSVYAPAKADLMTVGQLKGLLDQGDIGELIVTSYIQGVIDGMLAMETMHIRDHETPQEWCRLSDAARAGKPLRHPAFRAVEMVGAWERAGQPLDVIAIDMVLSFMDANYGCN